MYGFLVNPQQYNNAYPTIHYQQPPSASNGYGWHGNGYGWQRDPSLWHKPSVNPEENEAVEEPVLTAQKLEKQESYVSIDTRLEVNVVVQCFRYNLLIGTVLKL